MVINGASRRAAGWWAKHVTRTDTNGRVTLCVMDGIVAETVRGALREWEAIASGTIVQNYFYHASLSPERPLTDAQWEQSIDLLANNLGLYGQPYFVVEHEKGDRPPHRHVFFFRIDADSMKAISDRRTR